MEQLSGRLLLLSSILGLVLLSLSPLVFWPGWGDVWNDPQIFLINLGLLILVGSHLLKQALAAPQGASATSWSFEYLRSGFRNKDLWTFRAMYQFMVESPARLLGIAAILLLIQAIALGIFSPHTLALSLALFLAGLVLSPKFRFEGQRSLLFDLVAVSISLQGLLVLVQFFIGDPIPYGNFTDFVKWRATGTLGNPNRVGTFLSLGLLFLLNSDLPQSWLRKLAVGIAVLALACTLSRANISVLLLLWLWDHWRKGRWTIKRALRLGLIPVIAFLLVVMGSSTSEVFSSLGNVGSLVGRLNEYKVVIPMLSEVHPLWGMGWNQYGQLPGASSPHIHNEFLGAWIEGGAIGLVLLCLLTISFFKLSFSRKGPALFMLIFLLTISLVDFPLRNQANLVLLVLACLRPSNPSDLAA